MRRNVRGDLLRRRREVADEGRAAAEGGTVQERAEAAAAVSHGAQVNAHAAQASRFVVQQPAQLLLPPRRRVGVRFL